MAVGVVNKEAASGLGDGKLEEHQCKERVFDMSVKSQWYLYFIPQATLEPCYIIHCLNKY